MTRFTVDGRPEAEARVASDLDRIVTAVRREADGNGDPVLAIFLLGGYARGEGVVIRVADGSVRGFNDYDLLLVFGRPPRRAGSYAALSRRLAAELEIDFVDLGLATPDQLRRAPATLFWFELGEAHRVLWQGEGGAVALPRFRADGLEEAEGSRLLLNRGMGLLWARLRLDPEGDAAPTPGDLAFATTAAHKAVLAAGDAVLLRLGTYSIRLEDRQRSLREIPRHAPEAPESGLLDAYERAVRWRRTPTTGEVESARRLGSEARGLHESALRAAERFRLHRSFASWPEHASRVRRTALFRRLVRPRLGVRSLRAAGAGAGFFDAEEVGFMRLPMLLYADPEPARRPAWRAGARALVDRWHP